MLPRLTLWPKVTGQATLIPTATTIPAYNTTPQNTLSLTPLALPTTIPQALTVNNLSTLVEKNRSGLGSLRMVAWSPDGKTLALASALGVYMYEPENWKVERFTPMNTPPDYLVYLPDGRLLGVGFLAGQIEVWDLLKQELLALIPKTADPDTTLKFNLSPRGDRLLVDDARTVDIYQIPTGGKIAQLPISYGHNFSFTSDGTEIVGNFHSTFLNTIEIETSRVSVGMGNFTKAVAAIAISQDGSLTAASAEDGTVRIWKSQTGQEVASITDVYPQDFAG